MLDLSFKKSKDAAPSAAVLDVTDASFMTDVVEASRTTPVIVDFWAPWCGPCRQLTPLLEKAVAAANGAVRMVKVNIDENPRIAAQLRVQSIPTVYAFDGGQPIDGFQGALPESQIKLFVDKLIQPTAAGDDDLQSLLEFAASALEANDLDPAAQAYAQALQVEPENLKALAGLARCHLAAGDLEQARQLLASAPAGAVDPELSSARAALALAEAAGPSSAGLERRVAENPADHEARYELAGALAASGRLKEACDHLLAVLELDRDWNGGAARQRLLTVFEAAGPGSEVARAGRRRLSALLFA